MNSVVNAVTEDLSCEVDETLFLLESILAHLEGEPVDEPVEGACIALVESWLELTYEEAQD